MFTLKLVAQQMHTFLLVQHLRREMCVSRFTYMGEGWGDHMGGGWGSMQEEFRLSSAQGTPRCSFLSSLNLPLPSHFLEPMHSTYLCLRSRLWKGDVICKFHPSPSQSRGPTVGIWILWEHWVASCLPSSSSPSSPPPSPAVSSTSRQGLWQSGPPLCSLTCAGPP